MRYWDFVRHVEARAAGGLAPEGAQQATEAAPIGVLRLSGRGHARQ